MEDIGKLILRLTTAGLILFHGTNKIIHGIPRIVGMVQAHHLPGFIAYGSYIGEFVAPLFIIVGLWARVASLAVVINMIMAISLAAYSRAFLIQPTGGWGLELEAFYLLTALVVFFLGAGRYSVTQGKGALN